MADKAFIIREAQKYLAKGQIDKAIAEWESLLASSPDANSYNTAGDLYLRKNDRTSAVEKFHRAAEIFRKEGFSLKALAIYKKILNIAPSDARSLLALGELSEEKNISADAVKYYMTAADIFLREGRKDEAVFAYSKISGLQPDDLVLRKRLAEIFSKEGFVEETSQEYVEIARLLESSGEAGEAIGYLERAVEIKPGNRAALTAIASLYERLGDRGRAIENLKLAIARTGKSDVFLLWLAKLCLENGNIEEARQSARELLQLDPENLAASQMIASSFAKEGRLDKAWAEYEGVLERLEEKNRFREAIEILSEFRQAEPVLACKRLAALYRKMGESEAALRELKGLAGLLEDSGDVEGACLSLREALDLAPEDEFLKEKLRRLGGDEHPASRGDEGEEKDAGGDGGEGHDAGQERPSVEVLKQADRFIGLGLTDEARRLLEPLRLREPANIELHLKLKSVYACAGDKELAVTECIILAELMRRAGREREKEEMIEEAFRINPSDARLIDRWGARAQAEQAPAEGASEDMAAVSTTPDIRIDRAEYSEKLSEAAFYTDQGLYEEAEKIYNEFLARFPEDRNIRAKLAELAAMKSGPDAVIAASGSVIEGGAVKAAEALEGDLEKIFEDFKKGVEKELDPGDA
ncbi:MAG: tetratricopeptide repeat protein, partial [Nitrospiraceae bacterium]|nr:tetratricopeptide repeat protein [Nitrospiraceae bacterium]